MAIVKMSKIAIVGLEAEKNALLKRLMEHGFVQIDDSGYLTQEEELKDVLLRDGDDAGVAVYDEMIQKTETALALLKRLPMTKAEKKAVPAEGMFAAKPGFQKTSEEEAQALYDRVLQVLALQSACQSLTADESRLLSSRALLVPWSKFDVPLNALESRSTKTVLGTLPPGKDLAVIREGISADFPETFLGEVDKDKFCTYAYLTAYKPIAESALDAAKEFGFSPVVLDAQTTVLERIAAYDEEIAAVRQENESKAAEMKNYLPDIAAFRNLCDYFAFQRDDAAIRSNLIKTKQTFALQGWAPADKVEGLEKDLHEQFFCYTESALPEAEEEYPILLKNNAVVEPFESITQMYSTPGIADVDPTPIMTIFYMIFFGMMMADAGYGLLITLACFAVIKKAKYGKGEGSLIKLMAFCGITTTIWGIIFGSFFGAAIIPGIINPLEDVMLLMGMSLLFGLLHIFVGLAIKGYLHLKNGHVLDFFADVIAWYIFIIGVACSILPVVVGDAGVLGQVGPYIAIVGAVCIILTGGRAQKSIFMKAFKGVSALYGIVNYFGDVLSYTRLVALCLSSGVIAQVMNLLGGMLGFPAMILVFILGHAVNLFIGALGAYVHTSRLQFVEFFGKFYEGGGIQFRPFKFRTKYTNAE